MCISANVCPCRRMRICAPVCVLTMCACISCVCVTLTVMCVSFSEHTCFHVNVSVYKHCVSLSTSVFVCLSLVCVSPSLAWRPAWLCVCLL